PGGLWAERTGHEKCHYPSGAPMTPEREGAAMAAEERPSISELVREAQRGNPEAFDALVRRFRDLMVAVARQEIGSREAAEDVVQDALLQAFRALPQLQDPARFVPWLTVITRCRARRVG